MAMLDRYDTMKSIKRAMWHTALCGIACVVLGVAVYVAFFHVLPLLKEAPPELSEKIKDINDIEHLRKLALLLVSNERSTVRDFNGVLRSFAMFTMWCLIGAGVLFLINLGYLITFLREQQGKHVPRWLHWL